MPKNTEKVRFYFRGEKIAKCIGTLAHNIPKQDQEIEGVLGNGPKWLCVLRTQNGLCLTNCKVRKNYNYKIVAAKDLEGHAELKTSVVKQRMSINFTAPADLLKFYLEQLSFDVVEFGEPLRKWIERLNLVSYRLYPNDSGHIQGSKT